jgi:thioredoxin reductase
VNHPLVIVGAGPIGLAAAAHAWARGLDALVLESGEGPGAAVREWGHVRLFSSWRELVDRVAATLLAPTGWDAPDGDRYPTGDEWVDGYLAPLAETLAETAEVEIRYRHRVVGLAKQGRDRLVDSGRERAPFTVHVETPVGSQRITATAVIDASGTWRGPNPLGGDGLPAIGEAEHGDRIFYGIPDLSDPAARNRYAGRHIAVAGTGASAHNTLLALTALAREVPGTRVSWLVRRAATGDAFGGGDNDQLAQRGALGKRAKAAVESGAVVVVTSFRTTHVEDDPTSYGRLVLRSMVGTDERTVADVDEIIVVTGFRPDLSWLSEVRLDLDPVLSSPSKLAPMIDPNIHSCGTVEPHGVDVLAQPEPGLYLAGMKSYGRAPSFLALTGCEQTRSIVAAIAGDHEAAARVEMTLPESGVCGGSGQFDDDASLGGCCGPAASPELLTIGGVGSARCG